MSAYLFPSCYKLLEVGSYKMRMNSNNLRMGYRARGKKKGKKRIVAYISVYREHHITF